MYLPLYVVFYTSIDTQELMEEYFYTTRAARNFLWNNRDKIIDPSIYLFTSMTEIKAKDLRD
jgi:RNA-splicing ligase RtcB